MGIPFRRVLLGGVVLLAGLQLVPADHTNPPVESEVPASSNVRTVLRRACYDCHSNETVWPWYSRLAPVSFLLSYDVKSGRKAVNYSTWNRLAAKDQAKQLEESGETVAEGEMPPWYYVPMHAGAALSPEDRATLRAWAAAGGPATASSNDGAGEVAEDD